MPQHYSLPCGDGFVTLAQLNSPPAILDDYDMIDPNALDMTLDMELQPLPSVAGSKFNLDPSLTWKQPPNARAGTWPLRHRSVASESVFSPSTCNSPSPSNSPSPPGTVHHEQHQKRRAQNRQAQRAYRDRKLRYLLDLERGIRDIEHNMMRLQTENTELIRELCETRAENNDLRTLKRPSPTLQPRHAQPTTASSIDARISHPENGLDGQDPDNSVDNQTQVVHPEKQTAGELEALYEPFAAMWNLIQLDPSVLKGSVNAGTVLDRLRAMVELTATGPSRSNSTCSSVDLRVAAN